MTQVLLTGFGSWAGSNANPSERVARAFDGKTLAGARVSAITPPNFFRQMVGFTTAEIDRRKPDVVIMMGEFCGRGLLTVERLGQNLIDATRYGLGDSAGEQPQGEPVVPGGPAAYYATLPLRAMVKAMRAAGVPADISDTGGTFGCNLLMYGVLHHLAVNRLPIRAGWVHLPSFPATAALDENLGMPSMALDTQVAGLEAGIIAAVEHPEDIDVAIKSNFQL